MPEVGVVTARDVMKMRGTEVWDIHALAEKWDLFYEADHSTLRQVFEVFKERLVREGHDFEFQSFVYRNKIKPIVQKRAEAIPREFSFSLKEKNNELTLKRSIEG